MKCGNHTDREAIAACSLCGEGVCAECAEKTCPIESSCGIVCLDCYHSFCATAVDELTKSTAKLIFSLVVNIILLAIGAYFALPELLPSVAEPNYIYVIIGFAIAGAYGIVDSLKQENEKQAKHEAKYGAKYTAHVDSFNNVSVQKDNNFLGKVIAIMIAILFAPITSTVRIIKYIVKLVQNKKFKAFWKYELAHVYDA